MKKQLLTGAFLLAAFFSANAQDSCEDAFEITANGTYTVDAVDGEFIGACFANNNASLAEWYVITPTTNSLIRINTNLQVNIDGEADTRFSIISGSCDDLTCVDAMDDISATNYLGDLTFQAEANVTYYIVFDDNWSDTGFDFEVTITPETCFYPTGFAFAEGGLTTTTADLVWDAPITTPQGYEFEYGLAGFEPGSGIETLEVTSPEVSIEDLTSGTDYAFYVRTNCGNGDYSEWTGPITFTTRFDPAVLNYAYGFETNNLNGWTIATVTGGAFGVESIATLGADFEAQEGDFAMGAGASAAATNAWLFSRGIDFADGQVATITYYVSKFAGDQNGNGGASHNIGLTVGDAASAAAQTTVITEQTAVTSFDWVQRTATFTAPDAGTYYFGFHYTAPAMSQTNFGWGLIDNVVFTSPTGGVDQINADSFTVSPNPANSVVTIANANNMLINAVSIADINGRIVKTSSFEGAAQAQVNVSDLANGVYMMTISSEKGSVTKKIVKN